MNYKKSNKREVKANKIKEKKNNFFYRGTRNKKLRNKGNKRITKKVIIK